MNTAEINFRLTKLESDYETLQKQRNSSNEEMLRLEGEHRLLSELKDKDVSNPATKDAAETQETSPTTTSDSDTEEEAVDVPVNVVNGEPDEAEPA